MTSESGLTSGQLRPRLLKGESAQAFLSTAFICASEQPRPITGELYHPVQLRNLLSVGPFFVKEETWLTVNFAGRWARYGFLQLYLMMHSCS